MEKEGSLSLNSEGIIVRFSLGFEQALGYRENEVRGRQFFELAPQELKDEFRSLVEESRSSGAVVSRSLRFLRKDGAETEKSISIYPLRDLSCLHSFLIILNAPEQKGKPAILSDEFQRIFSFSNDAVIITDINGNIIDANKTFVDTYGYTHEEIIGANPRILKSSHSTKDLYSKMWADIMNPAIGFWKGEIINVARNGAEVPVLLSINAIKGADGSVRNFLGIAFNLTRQKELEKLNRLYINHVVHDLRGPLTTIMSNAELLLMKPEDAVNEKGEKKLKTIIHSVDRLHMMTNDILDYSKAQNKTLILNRGKVRIEKVLRDSAAPFERMGKRLLVNGSVFSEWSGAESVVLADQDKLQRIFYNLMSNAFKHAVSEVNVEFDVEGGGLRASVRDNGKGIPAEAAGRVFDAFYQTSEGVKSGGAGLGLNIVKCFVDLHGGNISIAPGESGGTSVTFFIPSN